MERAILKLAFLVCLVGCVRGSTGFQCANDTSCNAGTCEATGFCSFADATCDSGRRYGAEAGSFSNTCVESTTDAGVDLPIDEAIPGPAVVAHASSNDSAIGSLTYLLEVPVGNKRLLIVSVHLASDCGAGSTVPNITSVTFDGVALTQVATRSGTLCAGDTATRSDQWQLIAPDQGSHDVVITLDAATMFTIHSGAIALANVNQTTPIRNITSSTSEGTSSVVMVESAPGDLVVDTIGTGGMFTGPDASQSLVFQNNHSGGNTMDNSAASTKPGDTGMVTMLWTGNNDEWQDIAVSIQP